MGSRRWFALIAIALAILAVLGCSRRSPDATETVKTAPFVSPSEPGAFSSPLTAGGQPGDAPLLERDATPSAGRATVQGLLTIQGEPATGHVLYLASVTDTDSPEMSGVASLDPVTAPRAESDRSGYFCFFDVEPVKYALGISSPIGPVLIKRGSQEIVVEVKENEITEIGEVKIVSFN